LYPQWLDFSAFARSLFGLDQFTFTGMVPNLFNFAVLAALMTFLLYNPIKKLLEDRANRVAGELKEAEDKNLSASELKEKYEAKLKEIEVERTSILEEARKAAKDRQHQILEEAKAEAQDIRERASRDVITERDRIKSAVHEAIIDISTEMATKLISVSIDKNAHNRLFAEALTELESTAFKPGPVVA